MPRLIALESLDTPPVEIIQIDTGTLTIGREPENHVVVDSEAVSRQHGSVIEAQGSWIYKDLDSTNGSWINGVKLAPGQMRLLRHNDVIQLADFPVRVNDLEREQSGPRPSSLLIFFNDRFEAEFPLQPSRTFVIGGPAGDFYLEGVTNEEPQLEISYDGPRLELIAGASPKPIIVNGMAVGGVAALNDRDEIVIGPYRIVVNDLATAAKTELKPRPQTGAGHYARPGSGAGVGAAGPEYDRIGQTGQFRTVEDQSWASESSRRKAQSGRKFVFGTEPQQDEVTSTIGFNDFQGPTGFEMSASHRFSRAVLDAEEGGRSSLSENVLILFGILVFCMVIGFVVYFALTLM